MSSEKHTATEKRAHIEIEVRPCVRGAKKHQTLVPKNSELCKCGVKKKLVGRGQLKIRFDVQIATKMLR